MPSPQDLSITTKYSKFLISRNVTTSSELTPERYGLVSPRHGDYYSRYLVRTQAYSRTFSFPKFRFLPQELRDRIWDLALHQTPHDEEPESGRRDYLFLTRPHESTYCFLVSVRRGPDPDLEHWGRNGAGRLWRTCREAREAWRRKWRIDDAAYAAFRECALRSSALLRSLNPVWIPAENVAACSDAWHVKMEERLFAFDPTMTPRQATEALGALLGSAASRWKMPDMESWFETTPLFFRREESGGDNNRTAAYGLAREAALGQDCDFVIFVYAYSWPYPWYPYYEEYGPERPPHMQAHPNSQALKLYHQPQKRTVLHPILARPPSVPQSPVLFKMQMSWQDVVHMASM